MKEHQRGYAKGTEVLQSTESTMRKYQVPQMAPEVPEIPYDSTKVLKTEPEADTRQKVPEVAQMYYRVSEKYWRYHAKDPEVLQRLRKYQA